MNLHGKANTATRTHNTLPNDTKIVGVAVAVGSFSHHLKPYNECQTFLTIDGGLLWKKIFDEPMICELGDHGSLIVCAPYSRATNSISYSG